ncbi:hypothetical protein AADZ52_03900 [Listeria welshimeri]|nr:hypothetical protein [Listeria welshimeri]
MMIQKRLGHTNIQITLGTYVHLYTKADDQEVGVIGNRGKNTLNQQKPGE